MKLYWHAAGLVLALSYTTGCGRSGDVDSSGSIYQGTEDAGDSAVGLLIRNGKLWCSSTLVAPDTVLSAGHCFEGKSEKPESLFVSFDNGSVEVRVTDVIVHPNYSDWFGRVTNDFAVLKLERPVSIKPIPLAGSRPLTGEPVLFVGYGYKDATDTLSFDGTKRKGANVVGKVEDKKVFFPKPRDTETSQVCKGDSGGPIFANRGNQLELIGIVSGSVDAASAKTCNIEAYAARVDAFRTWLDPLIFAGGVAPAAAPMPSSDESASSTDGVKPVTAAPAVLPPATAKEPSTQPDRPFWAGLFPWLRN